MTYEVSLTRTPTQIIIWINDIIQCNHKCSVGVKHRRVSATWTHLIRGVSVLHRIEYDQKHTTCLSVRNIYGEQTA